MKIVSVRICGFKPTKSLREISKETIWVPVPQVEMIEPDLTQEKPALPIKRGNLVRNALVRNNHLRRQNTTMQGVKLYRAPDLVLLKNSHDSAVDIWPVGCVL